MNKVKSENYIVVQGWMISELNLKANDLLVYAIIYGFSQTEGQYFNGSLQYLAEWTNSTRQGIIKNLKNLLEMGLIEKIETPNGNLYKALRVNKVTEAVNSVTEPVNRVNSSSKQSLQNNIDNNLVNNKDIYTQQKDFVNKVETIIKHFNSICNTNFKSNTLTTRKLIKRHLNEGFTVDDFKKVIECKYQDWGVNPVKFSTGQMSNEYLRPSTLFGDKFENYVYEAISREVSEGGTFRSISSDIDPNVSDLVF